MVDISLDLIRTWPVATFDFRPLVENLLFFWRDMFRASFSDRRCLVAKRFFVEFLECGHCRDDHQHRCGNLEQGFRLQYSKRKQENACYSVNQQDVARSQEKIAMEKANEDQPKRSPVVKVRDPYGPIRVRSP